MAGLASNVSMTLATVFVDIFVNLAIESIFSLGFFNNCSRILNSVFVLPYLPYRNSDSFASKVRMILASLMRFFTNSVFCSTSFSTTIPHAIMSPRQGTTKNGSPTSFSFFYYIRFIVTWYDQVDHTISQRRWLYLDGKVLNNS